MPETVLNLSNGWTLRTEAGDNVRLCQPDGTERIYWDQNEWHEDPVGVMAAIFGAASRLPAANEDFRGQPLGAADNTGSVKSTDVIEKLLADWFEAALFRLSEVGHANDWPALIEDAKARHAALRMPWSNTFVPKYMREIMALDAGNEPEPLADMPTLVEDAKSTATCKHCGRSITRENSAWVDLNAIGDDAVWRETCDSHDTFTAEHEPLHLGPTQCDLCGDESNSLPGLVCGRIEYNDHNEPITSPCEGTYRSTETS